MPTGEAFTARRPVTDVIALDGGVVEVPAWLGIPKIGLSAHQEKMVREMAQALIDTDELFMRVEEDRRR
jgi:hypothetical protein